MAKSASAEGIAAAKREPGWKSAIAIARIEMPKIQERIASLNGEMSDKWAKITDGHKVDKVGMKMFIALDKLDADERVEAMRAFNKLCDNASWPEQAGDIVDQMEGTTVDMRAPVPQSDADEANAFIRGTKPKPNAPKLSIVNPLAAAKTAKARKPAPDGPDGDGDLAE